MCFRIFYNKKNAFLGYKNKKLKKSKNSDFLQTHGFGPKLAIFPPFYFRQYRPGKCVLGYSRRKKRLSRLWKDKVKTVEKFRFFPEGLTMVLVQNWPFFHHFILGNIGQENVFYDILEQQNAFLGYKNKKFK